MVFPVGASVNAVSESEYGPFLGRRWVKMDCLGISTSGKVDL
jgi:hypothetical protein